MRIITLKVGAREFRCSTMTTAELATFIEQGKRASSDSDLPLLIRTCHTILWDCITRTGAETTLEEITSAGDLQDVVQAMGVLVAESSKVPESSMRAAFSN